MKSPLSLMVKCCLLLLAISATGADDPLCFTASGHGHVQTLQNGKATSEYSRPFTMLVSGERYAIYWGHSDSRTNRLIALECVFDGTNRFFTHRFSKLTKKTKQFEPAAWSGGQQLGGSWVEKEVTALNKANVVITSGPDPFLGDKDGLATSLWMAFASRSSHLTDDLPRVRNAVCTRHTDYSDVLFKLNEAAPRFLQWRKEVHDASGPVEFSVMTWTNVGQFSFPQQMTLDSDRSSTVDQSINRTICSLSVDSIQLGIGTNSIAAIIPNRTGVLETRQELTGGKPFRYYYSETGVLLSSVKDIDRAVLSLEQ